MRARLRLAACVLAAATVAACSNPLGRQYEYDEQTYLAVDGSATVVVNSSLPALVALRGASLDPKPDGSADRDAIRQMYQSAGCAVDKVGRFWYRRGRRFVQVQVSTNDVRTLSKCALLSWSAYSLGPDDEAPGGLRFQQTVSPPAGKDPGTVNWDGSELMAFKLHAPSKIRFQNVKKLDGTNGSTERGNILTWEQHLADRRAGRPVDIAVQLEPQSILYRTLWLFAGAIAAALVTIAAVVVMVARRGRRRLASTGPRPRP